MRQPVVGGRSYNAFYFVLTYSVGSKWNVSVETDGLYVIISKSVYVIGFIGNVFRCGNFYPFGSFVRSVPKGVNRFIIGCGNIETGRDIIFADITFALSAVARYGNVRVIVNGKGENVRFVRAEIFFVGIFVVGINELFRFHFVTAFVDKGYVERIVARFRQRNFETRSGGSRGRRRIMNGVFKIFVRSEIVGHHIFHRRNFQLFAGTETNVHRFSARVG